MLVCMAVYGYSEETIEKVRAKAKRNALPMRIIGVTLIIGSFVAMIVDTRIGLRSDPLRSLPVVLIVLGMQLMGWTFRRGRKQLTDVVDAIVGRSYIVTEGEVRQLYPNGEERRFSREEIVRAEEVRLVRGLYIRSSNRYRWILVPETIDRYDEFKDELRRMGIPFVRRALPMNPEEWLFVAVYIGTLICPLVTHDRGILVADFVVALCLTFPGMLIIRANPDNRRLRKLAYAGSFLPAVLILAFLWLMKMP
ncbi:hypothetical protein ACFPT7_14600 [Acidicapsa dinghuensis]|uniref:Uncharacterized protein n=1 Tax=Acidicapsa dinghuensis TaxID=2218256 RepID=A0ABW1EKM9_9BACT|nr:hypothetical protein [Acidicapsa dinghuensis]